LTASRVVALVVGVLVLAYLLWYPTSHARPETTLLAQAIYFGVAAMGLNLLTGYNGQVSIGHGAFFGIGAFTSAVLVADHGWPYLATLPVAGIFALVIGVVAGFPALRVKGLYLALVTLGLAVLFPDLVKKFVDTGGSNIVTVRPRDRAAPTWWPDSYGGLVNNQYKYAFYVCLFCALVLLAANFLIVRSRFGRSLIAVRDHEAAAATVGINLSGTKLSAFAISALYAGIAGSLSVLVIGNAEANKATTFTVSILFLVAVVVGGTATVIGPIIGGFLVVYIQDEVAKFVDDPAVLQSFFAGKQVLSPALFGIALILMMYVLPDGIVGGLKRLSNRLRRTALKRDGTASAPATN
jgi:branched-chain amino acid transport system permease protein